MNRNAKGMMMRPKWLMAVCSAVLVGVLPVVVQAEEKAPAIALGAPFCDNAVLQREMKVPVWGWTEPGDTVTVAFAGQTVEGKTDGEGKFMVWLAPLAASFEPQVMTVSSKSRKSTVEIRNILVGEVWMASGQSNMQWKAGKSSCSRLKVEPRDGVNPIREFEVTSVYGQLHPIEKATGAWKDGGYSDYSAIAYAFAHNLYGEIGVPIGILNCSFSQTSIQAWVPREGYATAEDDYGKALHQACLITDPRTPEHKEAWAAFFQTLADQIAESEALIKEGKPANAISARVPGNMNGNRDATWMFNGRLNPVVPYALRGCIWNQGYANMNEGLPYYSNLHSLVRGWRVVWNRPDLPVYFHQFYTPGNSHAGSKPSIDGTAEMRLGTWMARDIPNTGMASQIDIGGSIHYFNKAVPARRLALHALKNQYGKNVEADGPMFKGYEVKGEKVVVSFEHADGGLVVADTAFNRGSGEGATGFADPKVIENGEDQVKLFWLAGEDKVWHPATFKIEGATVVVQSDAVKQPRGISYGSSGIGFQPCLYNKALLPMTPFIQYDHEMVTTRTWSDGKLRFAGADVVEASPTPADAADDDASADAAQEGASVDVEALIEQYRKMPLLSTQFRDDAVFQADQPVPIWGSTRAFGEWSAGLSPEGCQVHFTFGPQSGKPSIEKVIDVTPDMQEWLVTLPAMKAGPEPYTLKVAFTVDGIKVHERGATNVVFGDVWFVAAPGLDRGRTWPIPEVKPSGQIVRMLENQSMRDGVSMPSRFSISVSRTPRFLWPSGKIGNRFAAYWKDASGLAAAIGHRLAAQSGRPVGVIFMQSKEPSELKKWIPVEFLKEASSLMDDYLLVGSQYREIPTYLDNVRRYVAEWKNYWESYIPEMIATKAVPDGVAWGWLPSMTPDLAGNKATWTYNTYVHCFTPMALRGVIFITGKEMVAKDQGANFGPEMAALAKSFKARFDSGDIPFVYTVPARELAPKVSAAEIEGKATAVTVGDWLDVGGLLDALDK